MKYLKHMFVLILLIGFLSSCDEDSILNLQPKSELTSTQAWNTESQARSSMAGVIDQFRGVFNGDSYLHWFERRTGHFDFGLSGGGAGTSNWRQLFNNTLIASTSPGTNWQGFYRTINGVNLAIKYVPEVEFTNESEKQRMLAQAYFLRAYTYYSLARIYGDVPLPIEPFESVDGDLYLSRAPVSEVFSQIKQDVDMALELVPDNSPNERVLPSKAAMEMLKADVHIWTAKRMGGGQPDLQIADSAIDNVLTNSNYTMLENYADVFETEQNDEIIFALYFSIDEGGSQYGEEMLYRVSDIAQQYHNDPVPVSNNPQRNVFSEHFINTYLKKYANDSRLETNLGEFDDGSQTYAWINKFAGEWRDGARYFTDDTPLYRYSEAILFKAEILNALGQSVEAINYLNQVAERAYGESDFYDLSLSQEEVDDAILDERLIEFAAEGKAWMDYIRMGEAFERIPSLEGREGENEGNILLFPIDPGTMSRNPSITQTPGY